MFEGHVLVSTTGLTMVAVSAAIVTEVKLLPVTLAPDPGAGLVTLQTPGGSELSIIT